MISLINVVGKTGQLHAKESKQTTFSHQMDKDLSIRLEAIKLLKENTSSMLFESAFSAGDQGSIPGLGRSPGEESGNSLQCSCLENHMDRGAW